MDIAVGLKQGTVLNNRYRVESVIGMGGFGITYRAFDETLESFVAVKEYYPSGMVSRAERTTVSVISEEHEDVFLHGVDRFLREARDVVKFKDDPSIVSVLDFFKENGTAYMVMELLEGITLKEYLREHGGKIDEDMAVQVMFSLMNTLENIHEKGIVHRDISPDNVFICKDHTIKLIDFGAARISTNIDQKSASVVLKQGYAPVEQYSRKGNIGPWTDVYAFGALCYYMMTGQRPEESVERIIEDDLVPPKKLNLNISDQVNDVIMKALSVRKEDRYQNMSEMKEAFLRDSTTFNDKVRLSAEEESKNDEINSEVKENHESKDNDTESKPKEKHESINDDTESKPKEILDENDSHSDSIPKAGVPKGKGYFRKVLMLSAAFIVLALILSFGLFRKKDNKRENNKVEEQPTEGDVLTTAESTTESADSKSMNYLTVDNGILVIDNSLMGMSFSDVKTKVDSITNPIQWESGDKDHNITYATVNHEGNEYYFFFDSDSLCSVIYETQGSLERFDVVPAKDKYGDDFASYQCKLGHYQKIKKDYWYEWDVSIGKYACYGECRGNQNVVCQEITSKPYIVKDYMPENLTAVVDPDIICSFDSEAEAGYETINGYNHTDDHYYSIKVKNLGYGMRLDLSFECIVNYIVRYDFRDENNVNWDMQVNPSPQEKVAEGTIGAYCYDDMGAYVKFCVPGYSYGSNIEEVAKKDCKTHPGNNTYIGNERMEFVSEKIIIYVNGTDDVFSMIINK